MSRCLLNFAVCLSFASLSVLGGGFALDAQAQSLIPLSSDDPRVPQSFSLLGDMVQAGNVVWGGVYTDQILTQNEALHFCYIAGGRLPKGEDFEDLQNYNALGSVPAAQSTDRSNLMIWTAHETHFYSVDDNRFYQTSPMIHLTVRCVFDLPAPKLAAESPAVSRSFSELYSELYSDDQVARVLVSLRDDRATPPIRSGDPRVRRELAEMGELYQVNDVIWSSHVQWLSWEQASQFCGRMGASLPSLDDYQVLRRSQAYSSVMKSSDAIWWSNDGADLGLSPSHFSVRPYSFNQLTGSSWLELSGEALHPFVCVVHSRWWN